MKDTDYRDSITYAPFGYAYHKIVFDQQGKPTDCIFIDVNPAFEKLTALRKEDIIGKRALEILPELNKPSNWIPIYADILRNGGNCTCKQYSLPLSRWYRVDAYPVGNQYFTAVFHAVIGESRQQEKDDRKKTTLKAVHTDSQSTISLLQNDLKRKTDFEMLLFTLSSQLFSSDEDSLDDILQKTVKKLGEFFKADRAYIFQYTEDESEMSNTHEWCLPEIPADKEAMQNLPVNFFAAWIHTLKEGKEVHIHNPEELPETWKHEKEILQSRKIQSILIIPIIGSNTHYGFMGFDSLSKTMEWKLEERQLLQFFTHNIGEVLYRIEKEKRLEEALIQAKTYSAESERAKREITSFLAKISHEIRTSIHSIVGISRMLQNTELDANQRRYSDIIRSSSDLLLTLVKDILDFSRIEAGKVELKKLGFSLEELLKNCLTGLETSMEEKNLSLSLDFSPAIPGEIIGDPSFLSQIVCNLFGNAVKYTDSGGIKVSVRVQSYKINTVTISISVEDTGPGIPESEQDRIFEPFYQIDNNSISTNRGSGLGLPICRNLCSLMQGSISVNSVPGEGSRFTVEIPFALPQADEESMREAEQLLTAHETDFRIISLDTEEAAADEIKSAARFWKIPFYSIDSHTCILEKAFPFLESINVENVSEKKSTSEEDTTYTVIIADTETADSKTAPFLLQLMKKIKSRIIFIITAPRFSTEIVHFFDGLLGIDFTPSGFLLKPINPILLFKEFYSDRDDIENAKKQQISETYTNNSQKIKILVVEDILINQEIVLYQLQEIGVEAEAANNGAEAVKKVKDSMYDVILMDLKMPVMDGIEASRRIRQLEDSRKSAIPIIAMTANVLPEEKQRSTKFGINDYIIKPIQPKTLYQAIIKQLPDAAGAQLKKQL
ncbi:MAG: response regulator [Spirochaetia bacterium]|nr:response regulator [Spirochaetia bacterium]MCF7953785.1 response regulator [Spirochaetales bacterium]